MKKSNLGVIFIILIIIVTVSCIYIFKYNSIDNIILNKKWYHYDSTTGYYDIFFINDNNLIYSKYINLTDSMYNSCFKYDYDKKNKVIKSNCGLTIKIKSFNEDKITLIINNEELIFFTSIDQSYNNEFYDKYKLSVSEYKKEKSNIIDIIAIQSKKIKEIYLNNDEFKLIFSGNNCINKECTLALDVYEKWYSLSNGLYYVDSDKLTNSILKELNKLDSNFSTNMQDYNSNYPTVYIIKNKIIDKYQIKCSGLDCSSYYTK